MDRRKSLKILAGGAATGAFISGCTTDEKKDKQTAAGNNFTIDRSKEELEREKKLAGETFFSAHEMQTITILADIIIPKDEISGSASEAKVPEFIEFIVKDMPDHQVPMRGGLRWLDMQCLKRYNKTFIQCSANERLSIVDEIAWPQKAKPEMRPGVSFFNLMRNLTASGFYSSAMGIKDIGYAGNVPNKWNGVPDDVLKQYNLSYTQKELNECVRFDNNV